jgi:hypothetical protein
VAPSYTSVAIAAAWDAQDDTYVMQQREKVPLISPPPQGSMSGSVDGSSGSKSSSSTGDAVDRVAFRPGSGDANHPGSTSGSDPPTRCSVTASEAPDSASKGTSGESSKAGSGDQVISLYSMQPASTEGSILTSGPGTRSDGAADDGSKSSGSGRDSRSADSRLLTSAGTSTTAGEGPHRTGRAAAAQPVHPLQPRQTAQAAPPSSSASASHPATKPPPSRTQPSAAQASRPQARTYVMEDGFSAGDGTMPAHYGNAAFMAAEAAAAATGAPSSFPARDPASKGASAGDRDGGSGDLADLMSPADEAAHDGNRSGGNKTAGAAQASSHRPSADTSEPGGSVMAGDGIWSMRSHARGRGAGMSSVSSLHSSVRCMSSPSRVMQRVSRLDPNTAAAAAASTKGRRTRPIDRAASQTTPANRRTDSDSSASMTNSEHSARPSRSPEDRDASMRARTTSPSENSEEEPSVSVSGSSGQTSDGYEPSRTSGDASTRDDTTLSPPTRTPAQKGAASGRPEAGERVSQKGAAGGRRAEDTDASGSAAAAHSSVYIGHGYGGGENGIPPRPILRERERGRKRQLPAYTSSSGSHTGNSSSGSSEEPGTGGKDDAAAGNGDRAASVPILRSVSEPASIRSGRAHGRPKGMSAQQRLEDRWKQQHHALQDLKLSAESHSFLRKGRMKQLHKRSKWTGNDSAQGMGDHRAAPEDAVPQERPALFVPPEDAVLAPSSLTSGPEVTRDLGQPVFLSPVLDSRGEGEALCRESRGGASGRSSARGPASVTASVAGSGSVKESVKSSSSAGALDMPGLGLEGPFDGGRHTATPSASSSASSASASGHAPGAAAAASGGADAAGPTTQTAPTASSHFTGFPAVYGHIGCNLRVLVQPPIRDAVPAVMTPPETDASGEASAPAPALPTPVEVQQSHRPSHQQQRQPQQHQRFQQQQYNDYAKPVPSLRMGAAGGDLFDWQQRQEPMPPFSQLQPLDCLRPVPGFGSDAAALADPEASPVSSPASTPRVIPQVPSASVPVPKSFSEYHGLQVMATTAGGSGIPRADSSLSPREAGDAALSAARRDVKTGRFVTAAGKARASRGSNNRSSRREGSSAGTSAANRSTESADKAVDDRNL